MLSVLGQSSVVGVLFVDVDGLKGINDRFGHLVGDQAVRVIGTLLRESLRYDRDRPDVLARTPETDDYSVSHYGGDEFVAALELKAADDILGVVKRLRDRVNDPSAQRHRGFDVGSPAQRVDPRRRQRPRGWRASRRPRARSHARDDRGRADRTRPARRPRPCRVRRRANDRLLDRERTRTVAV